MHKPVFMLLVFCGWIGFFSSLAAITLNLPYPIGVRILLLAVGMWGYWVLRALDKIPARLARVEYWARANYVASSIRNESDNLRSSRDQMRDDMREQIDDDINKMETNLILSVVGMTIMVTVLSVILHFGFFGDFGANWASNFGSQK